MADPPVTQELAAAAGRGIEAALGGFVGEILLPQDPTLAAIGGTYDAYRLLLRDDQVAATLQQRALALTSREWDVEPASGKRQDRQAAEFVREQLARIGWDDVTRKMLFGVFYGFAVGECIWRIEGSRVILDAIRVRRQSRFRFDRDGRLRLLSLGKPDGEIMPERKFWTFSYGAEADDPYGRGLASYLYWPVWLKRNAAKFWAIALEKFAMPTPVGKYPPGAVEEVRKTLLQAAMAVATDQAVIIPSGTELDLLEAQRASGGDHEAFCRYWDGAIAKIVLSQTMTTDSGSSRAQAQVHMDVRQDVVEADADLICASFSDQVARWLTEWNFPTASPPKVWRDVEPPEDLQALAARDKTLVEAGFEPDEAYIKEKYGDGWSKKAAPAAPAAGQPAVGQLAADPAPAAQPPADPAFAEEDGVDDAVDPLVETLDRAAEPAIDAMVGRIRSLLDDSADLAEASEKLLTLYPQLDIDALATAIGDALVVAELTGRSEDA
jgi:phage gp29-like protein